MPGFRPFVFVLIATVAGIGGRVHAQNLGTSTVHVEESGLRRPYTVEWKFRLSGENEGEGKDAATAAHLRFFTKLEYKFFPWLKAHLEPRFEFYSSNLQARFEGDDYQNKFTIGDTYLSLKPIRYMEARGGAVGQRIMGNDFLLGTRRSFPGVMAIFSTETEPFNTSLMVEHVIPTSYTLSDERVGKEAVPSLQIQAIKVEGKHPGFGNWHGTVGHYTWSNLPDKVAFESAIQGNTVTNSEQTAGARFAYGFDGFYWGGTLCVCDAHDVFPVGLKMKYRGAHNRLAPSQAADAELLGAGPQFKIGSTDLSLMYSRFFIESDASVARYGRSKYGYANRVGDQIEAVADFKNSGFSLGAHWTNALPVADRPTQQTYSDFMIWVETDYARF